MPSGTPWVDSRRAEEALAFLAEAGAVLAATGAASGENEPEKVAAGAGVRVLIVDDNVDAARSLALMLRCEGHDVAVAHEGCAALEAACYRPPEVIFLDLGLPGMDGYEVARALRRAGLSEVLLVALTGYGQEEDRRRTQEAGFDHHLVKPADSTEIRRLLAERRRAK